MRLKLALLLMLLWACPAFADDALVVNVCGTLPLAYSPGSTRQPTVDINGKTCGSDAGSVVTANQGTPGSVNTGWPTIGGELTTDATGTFTNATQTTSITANGLDGYGTALVSINGTYGTATAVFELSDDAGTTWYSVQGSRINACAVETGYTGLTNTSQGWIVSISGADSFRLRSTAVASGTVNARISISSAVPPNGASACPTASQNNLGNVGGLTKTVCVTPTVTNGTYAANNVIGPTTGGTGVLQFANLFTSTGHGIIQTVALDFTTAQTVGFKLYPLRASPSTTYTDHTAASISGFTDIGNVDQPIQLANPDSGLGTMTNYGAIGLGQAYNPAGTSGFFVLVPTATTASLGGTASVVQVCVTVLQDS